MGPKSAVVLRTEKSESGELLEEVACLLCDAYEQDSVLVGEDLLYGKPGSYPVKRCRSCGLLYVNPRPTMSALGAHYPDNYFCYQPVDDAPWPLRAMLQGFVRDTALRRLRYIERVTGTLTESTKLVDVGCGLNDFLRWVHKERGTTGIGVDLKDTVVQYVRETVKMPIVEGTLESANFEAGSFDLVTMMEYLEHEPNPRPVLAEARRILKPGGHLAIEIPWMGGWPARTFKSAWANLDLPRHLVFFDRDTLNRALAEQGFELVSFETFGIPFYSGLSVLFWLGKRNAMQTKFSTEFLAGMLGAPLLPALPWLHEFAFAVARAV